MTQQKEAISSPTDLPETIDRVLVPILQPKYSQELIDLALSAADSEDARILALIVSLGNVEEDAEVVRVVEPVVQAYQDAGRPVQLISYGADSISRGILDVAREQRVDLILFGGREFSQRGPNLSTVTENVLPVAPCYVVVYRLGIAQDYQRLLMPVFGGQQSRSVARLALRLGQNMDLPVEALYTPSGRLAVEDARTLLDSVLAGIPGEEDVKRTVVEAQDAVSGMLSRANNDDILVIGATDRTELERWFREDVVSAVLKRWRGGLLLVSPTARPLTLPAKIRRWLSPTLTQFEQIEIEQGAEASATTSLDYLVLILIAAILATFGLMLNSNAVIIGAMLVAPLMSPLIAFAVGMTLGKLNLVGRATLTLIQGIIAALLVSLLIGAISPTSIVTTEMAGRGNPSLLDMGVALASGFIGAYATARKHIPAALAGVAIAAALMPPLTTVGLGLAYGDFALASGAFLLFVTNIISIILAAWATFFWLGMRPSRRIDVRETRRTSAALVVLFVLVLAALLAQNAKTIFSATIENTLRASFQQSDLVGYEVRQGDPIQVIATIRMAAGIIPDNSEIIAAQDNLEQALDEPVDLSVIIQPVVDARVAQANEEVEAAIDTVLNERLLDMNVLGFRFEIGNPTLVLAVVQTDLDPSSEAFNQQAGAAEAGIEQALGLPASLSIITIESYDSSAEAVDATDEALNGIIEETLVESLTCCQVLRFSFTVGNPFVVTATAVTDMDPSSDEFLAQIQRTEDALADALGWPVRLTVIVAQATPTATVTPLSAPPGPTPTPELPTTEPTTVPPTPEPTEVPPTLAPTPEPTEVPPTPIPTEVPPTSEPTPEPTEEPPTLEPTVAPTVETPIVETPTATIPTATATP